MTITPLPLAAQSAPARGSAGRTPATPDCAEFGALVLAHLARISGAAQTPVPGDAAGPDVGSGAAGSADDATAGTTGSPVSDQSQVPGGAALPVLQAAPAAAALCAAPIAVAQDAQPTPEEADPAATSPAAAGDPGASPAAPGIAAGVERPKVRVVLAGGDTPAQATGDAAGSSAPESTARSSSATTASSSSASSASSTSSAPSAPTVPAVLAGVTWTATTTATADVASAAAAPGTPDAGPLMDQVTPVVARLVSAGEGSHRMVLRLHPADLGEVHVTVTVRGEDVDVTVAASREAREMLAEGSTALRSLLDSVGRTAGQVVFRDLPGAMPVGSLSGQAGPGTTADAGAGAGGADGEPFAGSGPGADGRAGSHPGRPDHPDAPGTRPVADRPASVRAAHAAHGRGALDVRI